MEQKLKPILMITHLYSRKYKIFVLGSSLWHDENLFPVHENNSRVFNYLG